MRTKKNKIILDISSIHHGNTIDTETGHKRRSDIITVYNNTKYEIDVVDQMCVPHDVVRNTRRWPLPICFNVLNVYILLSLHIYSNCVQIY